MKAEIKTNWLAALRSGKYMQATEALRDALEDGRVQHCCLGVLCDIIDPARWVDGAYAGSDDDDLDSYDDMPPQSILGVAKLSCTAAEKLATMNDNGSTFQEIADYIEIEL